MGANSGFSLYGTCLRECGFNLDLNGLRILDMCG